MGTAAREGVEFLDPVVGAPGPAEPSGPGEQDGGHRPRRRATVLAVLVVGGVLVAARAVGAPPPVPPAAAAEAPVFAGEVELPAGFGAPTQLATAAAVDEDVLWVRGDGGRVVRVAAGKVTAVSPGHDYHALAVRPDGRAVYVSTGRLAPTVVALDPLTLTPRGSVLAAAPVTALAVGVGSVWAASADSVQGWTSDLHRALRTMRLPDEVTSVRSLTIVGARLQAVVSTAPGTSALLRLEPPGGGPRLTSSFTGPVSVVPGVPALVAHVASGDTVEVSVDPSQPGLGALARPFPVDASIWPGTGVGTASWVVTTRTSSVLECYDATGRLVGRMAVGDDGHGILGPVATTSRAVYAGTVAGSLARGGHASCAAAPTG